MPVGRGRMPPSSVEAFDDLEPLEDDQGVVVELEARVAEARTQVIDIAVPEPLVRNAELGGVGVPLPFVDRMAVIDVGKPDDPAVDRLHDRDRSLVRIDEELALARSWQGCPFDLEVDE